MAFKDFPEDIVPIKQIYDKAYILELFHGPSCTFKDISLSVVGLLVNLVLEKHKKRGLAYVATSGDTGSAIIHVTKNLSSVNTLVFFPDGDRITQFQRLMMTTVSSKNIHNFAGNCFCDNFDIFHQTFAVKVKEIYPELVVTSFNSVSWMRVLLQIAHLMYAYFKISKNLDTVEIVIPTGGAGHLTGM